MSEHGAAEHDKLKMRLDRAGWHVSNHADLGNGVRLTFRRWPWTSDFPGVPTFDSFGKNDVEAMENALQQLEAWGAADLERRLKEAGWQVQRMVPTGGGVQVTFQKDPAAYVAKSAAQPVAIGSHLYDAIRVFLEQLDSANSRP